MHLHIHYCLDFELAQHELWDKVYNNWHIYKLQTMALKHFNQQTSSLQKFSFKMRRMYKFFVVFYSNDKSFAMQHSIKRFQDVGSYDGPNTLAFWLPVVYVLQFHIIFLWKYHAVGFDRWFGDDHWWGILSCSFFVLWWLTFCFSLILKVKWHNFVSTSTSTTPRICNMMC